MVQKPAVKVQDAIKSLENLIECAEQNNMDMEMILVLHELRDIAIENSLKYLRQTSVIDFFL